MRAYNERILKLENGSFVLLIFSIAGGMGKMSRTFIKLMCSKISTKKDEQYNDVLNLFRCKLSFLIYRMAILCIRGLRSLRQKQAVVGSDCAFECNEAAI